MLEGILASPAVHAIGWALIAFTWQAALVGAATALLLWILASRDAQWRYALACLALVIMTALPLLTALTTLMSYKQGEAGVVAMTLPATTAASLPQTQSPTITGMSDAGLFPSSSVIPTTDSWLPIIVLIWFAGVSAFSIRLAGGWLLVRRMIQSGTPVADELAASVSLLALRLHLIRPVRTLKSALVDTPTVVGWLRPVVLLPFSAIAGLAPEQLEAVIAHELAHVRRHDYAVNFMQRVTETLFFYHPAVWWLSNRIRLEREQCADDLAVAACGDATLYAAALRDLEQARSRTSLAMAATGGSLAARIGRLLGQPPARERWAPAWIAILLAAVVFASGLGTANVTTAATNVEEAEAPVMEAPAGEQTVPTESPGTAIAPSETPQPVIQDEPDAGALTGTEAQSRPNRDFDVDVTVEVGEQDADGTGFVGGGIGASFLSPWTSTAEFLRLVPNYTAALEGATPQVTIGENFTRQIGQNTTYMGVTISDGEARGVTVRNVESESPADEAGIQAGDVITELDGMRVVGARQFTRMIQETPAGRAVPVTVVRSDEVQVLNVVLRERPNTPLISAMGSTQEALDGLDIRLRALQTPFQRAQEGFGARSFRILNDFPFGNTLRLGLEVQNMTPELREFFGAPSDTGVLVTSIDPDSPADEAGVQVGDVIIAAGDNPVVARNDLIWSAELEGDAVGMRVVRDHSERDVTVRLDIPPQSWRITP